MSGDEQASAVKDGIRNDKLRQDIERFYLPRQLVNAITEIGAIPNDSEEAIVGIGFLDIADYTFLSKFLSPNENQTVLNGLYSAFNWVLNKHGGYLNKLEGDSLMFQYGGPIDPNVRGLSEAEAEHYIARELFYTCIELQRVCILFNQANDKFLYSEKEGKTKEEILKAFDIIRGLRNNEFLSPSINALFQIRIRIGASIGKVMIGNFGPEGSKHWDVIGMPVINAKRMESTAPLEESVFLRNTTGSLRSRAL
ncbi:MAG: adenylate/guanylate cyclase domain-containing protein [Spirochaetales bacterium]|nr:adenylate/guanylate cyclase domain-containing protein [Spirochaetales bacterium]